MIRREYESSLYDVKSKKCPLKSDIEIRKLSLSKFHYEFVQHFDL